MLTFAHCKRQLGNVDAINSYKIQSGHENYAWLCLNLFRGLVQASERGLSNLFGHCLNILVGIALKCQRGLAKSVLVDIMYLQTIQTLYNLIQCEVSLAVVPVIYEDASVGGILLHPWHVNLFSS